MAKKFDKVVINALNELLQFKPLDKLSATDITYSAGLTKQAFYYYAKSLPDYLCMMTDNKVKDIIRPCRNSVNEVFSLMRQILLYFRENKTIFTAMMQSKQRAFYLEHLYKSVYNGIHDLVKQHIRKLLKESREEISEPLARYISDSVFGVLYHDLQSGMTTDVDDIMRNYKLFYGEAYSITLEKYLREAAKK